MGSIVPAMARATILTLSIIGLSFRIVKSQNIGQCEVAKVSHHCTGASGSAIVNICWPTYDIRNLQNCIRRGRQVDSKTCFPCCEDDNTNMQFCGKIRDGSENPRFTFDTTAAPEMDPCEAEYDERECVQHHYKATGARVGSDRRGIQTWQECQEICRETENCEWFTYIAITYTCQLKRVSRRRRNLKRVSVSQDSYSGSTVASALTSPNCNCLREGNRYDRGGGSSGSSRSSGSSGSNWGWGGWHNPCPVGTRQNQNLFGHGMVTCCPVQAGTDGTPVCRF